MNYVEQILEFELFKIANFSLSVYNLFLVMIIYFAVKGINHSIDLFIKNLQSFKKDIQSNDNKSITKKLIDTKKVRKKIIKLKQDTNKPDFGRNT